MTKSITVDPTSLPTLQAQMFKYFGSFVVAAVLVIFVVYVGSLEDAQSRFPHLLRAQTGHGNRLDWSTNQYNQPRGS